MITKLTITLTLSLASAQIFAQAERNSRTQPGTQMEIYLPAQHELYDGRFKVLGLRIYQVGPHGRRRKNVRPVQGEALIDIDEITNTGSFRASLKLQGVPTS